MGKKVTTEEFIRRSKRAHGDKYDYSRSAYVNAKTKVLVTCASHGEFLTNPYTHMKGHGCSKCGIETTSKATRSTKEDFVKKAEAVHKGKYSYKAVVYINAVTKIRILCSEHGYFEQSPYTHLKGHGCAKCRDEALSRRFTKSTEDFITIAVVKHGDTYDYSKTAYIGARGELTVVCKNHGEFTQRAEVHLRGGGCPKCAEVTGPATNLDRAAEKFIPQAEKVHGNKYDYTGTDYVGYNTPVTITCKKHGEFTQNPGHHLQGCGCPKCGGSLSHREDDIALFLKEWTTVVQRDRKILSGKELDMYLPEHNLAIEYNGSYFHSDKFVKQPKTQLLNKQELCAELGIRLIHVSDYEDQTVIKKTLSHILGIDEEKYFARKCTVAIRSSNEDVVTTFLDSNHLQGSVKGCTAYCLEINGAIVACMLFSLSSSIRGNSDRSLWELRRFSSCCRVVGGASRLLKAFLRDNSECTTLISYSDSRWFNGNMYKKLGFEHTTTLPPDYKYNKGRLTLPKNKFRRAALEQRADIEFRPEESERENALRNGWNRLWDCGKKRWELIIEKAPS